ncbi:MAG: hypothetical protein HY059_22495 [Proteobacteria bacterium]|nr:hypothetical protein [Pseudomonadota bacterium]
MRKTILVLAALVCAGAPLAAQPINYTQESPNAVGVGVNIGVPFGLSAKYNFDSIYSADFALGAQGDSMDIHGDFLIHLRDLWPNPPQGKLPLYIGMGMKIKDESEMLFGIRFVAGLAYLLPRHPIELFVEAAPVLRLAPSTGSNFDAGCGLRYFFRLGK